MRNRSREGVKETSMNDLTALWRPAQMKKGHLRTSCLHRLNDHVLWPPSALLTPQINCCESPAKKPLFQSNPGINAKPHISAISIYSSLEALSSFHFTRHAQMLQLKGLVLLLFHHSTSYTSLHSILTSLHKAANTPHIPDCLCPLQVCRRSVIGPSHVPWVCRWLMGH